MTDMTGPAAGLSRPQLRTLALAALGGALEFYDFVIFVFFAKTMGQLFFPPDLPGWMQQVQAFGIFAAGYLARPLGGIVMAHFGDRSGRKRMFLLSVLLMAVPTLLMGLLPTYAQAGVLAPALLLLLRLLQGAAIGGEAPGAWVFVSEHVAPRHRSLACGTLSAGLLAGILLGALVATAVSSALDEARLLAWGWRLPFVIGGVFGLLAMLVRRRLQETPVFEALRARQALESGLPVGAVLRRHPGGIALAMLLSWLLTAAVVVPILMMPTFLQAMGIARSAALAANSFAIACAMLGNLAAGLLADRYGAGRILALWSALLGAAFWLFTARVGVQPGLLWPLYGLVGFGVGLTALVPSIAVGEFPAALRFSGLSFAYNVTYAIAGGLTPVLLSLAFKATPTAPLAYVLAMCALGMALGVFVDQRGARAAAPGAAGTPRR